MNYANISEEKYFDLVLKRLNEYISKNKIKQLDLAKDSHINQSTLSKILRGDAKLTLSHIFRLCNALNIDPEMLLSFDQEIISDVSHQTDTGIINRKYINDQILIRNTKHPAFKGYLGNSFFIYLYSTISSESSLLEGKIFFEDTEYHNYCKVSMILYTGQLNSKGQKVEKKYLGELVISLTMGTCYCILINSEIGEICSLNFKHTFLFNQKLICRVATVISTSSGSNRLPIMQRALITETELHANNPYDPDSEFIRGQLKLNDSEIILKKELLDKVIENHSSSDELIEFLKICKRQEIDLLKEHNYIILDENKIRSINAASHIKAQGISILRNISISPKYNKISTKTEEFTFQYINNKENIL